MNRRTFNFTTVFLLSLASLAAWAAAGQESFPTRQGVDLANLPPGLLRSIQGSLEGKGEEQTPVQRGASPALTERHKLATSDSVSFVGFGYAVALSGDLALVGAVRADGLAPATGAAYLFQRDQGGPDQWGEVKKLFAADGEESYFGNAVALDGDTALVGARDAEGGGSAYIFERHHGGTNNWGQVKRLLGRVPRVPAGGSPEFGSAVALRGDTALVGAPFEDAAGLSAGTAYIFGRHQGGANTWGEVKQLFSSHPEDSAYFGSSVALDGHLALVGAYHEMPSGAAYLFSRDQGGANQWGEVKALRAAGAAVAAELGWALALSGDTALVGARRDQGGAFASGAVYIFERNQGGSGQWGESRRLVASDPAMEAHFGAAVALAGDLAIVGAPDHGFPGVAYLFARDLGGVSQWGERDRLVPSDAAGQAGFAASVALAEGWVLAGLERGVGGAYLFLGPMFADGFESGDTSAWTQTVP